ncbi:Gfo/Idh/MocA family protein [Nocardioides campestrisoli]|uniref:Gfo/Idh/MocA family protein n=1 Tax=Nocardioides campestrisoli TaxID=2736757 RepID=UPI00163DB819|nr:Gfo/Idh/MocA family oxidoreductase [Nocardioides campestrisoli]
MERLRVGVAGTSHWAREVHVPGVAAAEHVDLVAVWGRDPGRREPLARQHGVVACTSFEELVDRVDVVTFAVPPQVQPGLAVVAARAGRHLLLEKPVAVSVREAAAVQEAVREGGGRAMVFFTRRLVPEVERFVEQARGREWSRATVRAHSDVMVTQSPYRDSQWRGGPRAALWDLAPHALSVLLPVLGPVRQVTAAQHGRTVVLTVQHAGGAQAEISVSLHADSPADEIRLHADGSEAALVAPTYDGRAAFVRALDRLAALIRDPDREDPLSLDLGVEVTRVLEAAEQSLLGSGA